MSEGTTDTLTSLAILKVNIDHGGDYLGYLRPFVLQVLFDKRPEYVTDESITDALRMTFGLEIPTRTVQIVLRRLAKSRHLRREHGVYVLETITDPGMRVAQDEARRNIRDTLDGLIDYARRRLGLCLDDHRTITAICTFLSYFNVSCLRAYLRGTAIPDVQDHEGRDVALVSKYVLYVQENENELFEKFLVVVQGHMLANALLCPDLKSAKDYRRTTFYLDTPLLIQLLGLEGESRQAAANELNRLLTKLGGQVAIFSHTREELSRVLDGAAAKIDATDGRGRIVEHARRTGVTKSDFLLLTANVDDRMAELGISVRRTPEYYREHQIDESRFEGMLDDGVAYFNTRAKEYDVNSVRSIYVLRRGSTPSSLETSRAILVTSNTAFARAAWDYGRRFEASREVSSVISDFSLANIAWLKAPMGAPSLPMVEVIAFSYAAVQPSSALVNKFLLEIDRLEDAGRITERDHKFLRSNPSVYGELVSMTLGDDAALSESGVRRILDRAVREITHEADEKLSAERDAHRDTEEKRRIEGEWRRSRDQKLYWRLDRVATWVTGVPVILSFIPAVWVGLAQAGYWVGVVSGGPMKTIGMASWTLWTLVSVIAGATVLVVHRRMKDLVLRWLLRWTLIEDPQERR